MEARMKNPCHTTSLDLPLPLFERVRQIAFDERTTQGAVINELIVAGLQVREPATVRVAPPPRRRPISREG
jgi:hypothetical protein